MDDKKQIKATLKTIGKKHVNMLREAFGDSLTISWLDWDKQQLGGKTPRQAIVDGEIEKVRGMIEYLYDLSALPPDEPEVDEEEDEEYEDD